MLEDCPKNQTIGNNLIKAYSIINNPKYKKILCSISGGSDSDIMLDICIKCDINHKIDYVWFNTGIEYQATKDHLQYLENKYKIKIERQKAIKAIPISCKEYGIPFLSKKVSLMINGLQRHNFKFEDKSLKELLKEYNNCKSYLEWWCNENKSDQFNIRNNKWLKEFMIENPPTFPISNACCKYAKKDVAKLLLKSNNYDLNIIGIRKAERGLRANKIKNCFDENSTYDNYRPLFWYKDKDKQEYENYFNIVHSRCYSEYGLTRTGCVGCPFNREFEFELNIVKQYEPKLYIAVDNIFKASYEYTRQYKIFYENKELLKLK